MRLWGSNALAGRPTGSLGGPGKSMGLVKTTRLAKILGILECLGIAVAYLITARFCQLLAIEPGNVTAVWIPSGIILAAVLLRGYRVWPGIWLGALAGNIWAYFDAGSPHSLASSVFSGTANGVGDVLCAVGGAYFIVRTTGTNCPFNSAINVTKFIAFGALAGPLISAVFGATSLCLAGIVAWDSWVYTGLTWWTGDCVGVLTITPVIIVAASRRKHFQSRIRPLEAVVFAAALLATSLFSMGFLQVSASIHFPLIAVVPILMWAVFRMGQLIAFSSVLLVASLAIIATVTDRGAFSGMDLNAALVNLQLLLAVTAVTGLVLNAAVEDAKRGKQQLDRMNTELEERVERRAAQLRSELSERQRVEEELRFQGEITAHMSGGINLVRASDGTLIYANPKFEEMFGYDTGELVGKHVSILNATTDKDPNETAKEIIEHLNSEGSWTGEIKNVRKDGTQFWCHGSISPFNHPEHGRIWISVHADITERKRTEESLLRSEERLRVIAEASADYIILLDRELRVQFVNRTVLHLSREDLVGEPLYSFVEDADVDRIRNLLESVLLTGEKIRYETTCRLPDGDVLFFESVAVPLGGEGGEQRVLVNSRNITERKRAEEAHRLYHGCLEITARHPCIAPLLKELVSELREYTGCSAVGIRVLDEQGNIPYQAHEGFSREFYELESPLSIHSDRCMCINVIKGNTDADMPFFTPGGSFHLNATSRFLAETSEDVKGETRNACNQFGFETVALTPIRAKETIVGMIHIADERENMIPTDAIPVLERVGVQIGVAIERSWATDREDSLRAELVHMGRLTTMGEMASGLAHELNQPLAAIEMFAHIASRYAMPGQEGNRRQLIDACDKISSQAIRAGELIHRMRQFVGKVEPTRTAIDFASILGEVMPLVENDFRIAGIDIHIAMDEPLPAVIADKVQVEQVLLNLARNALEAIQNAKPEKGELRIAVAAQDGVLEVELVDNGQGIPAESLDDVFSTFYSTKPEGMGIGLAICRSIIEAHGGRIWAESSAERGTTFTFTLSTGTIEEGRDPHAQSVHG